MDRSEAHRLAGVHLRPMANFLGLSEWHLWTANEAIEGGTTPMQVLVRGEYRHARVVIDADKIASEDDFVDLLAHELFHLVLWPIHMYQSLNRTRIGDDLAALAVDSESARYAEEMQVANLVILWLDPLRDIYLERLTRP